MREATKLKNKSGAPPAAVARAADECSELLHRLLKPPQPFSRVDLKTKPSLSATVGFEALTQIFCLFKGAWLLPSLNYLLDHIGRNSYVISMKTTVSQKGQVTIPKTLRQRLGIRPGNVLDFHEKRGRLVATKVTAQDPVESVYGILRLGRPTDDLIASLRGKADAV